MKKLILLGLVAFAGVSSALANDGDSVVPGSNQLTPVIAAAAAPAAVAISSLTVTRIDTAANTALSTALGAGYKRASVHVQVLDGAKVNCGYTTAVTTQTSAGFQFEVSKNPVVFNFGKAIGIYCQGIVSTATFIVGGLGWK